MKPPALARLPAAVEDASGTLVLFALGRGLLCRALRPALRAAGRTMGIKKAAAVGGRVQTSRALWEAGSLLSLLGTGAAALRTAAPASRCEADPEPSTPVVVAGAALVLFCCTARVRVSLWALIALRAAAEERGGGGLVWLILGKGIASYFGSHGAFVSALLIPAAAAHFALCRSHSSGAAALLGLSSACVSASLAFARWVWKRPKRRRE